MIYITGDMHGDIQTFKNIMGKITCKLENTLIVLGDLGANYYLNKTDKKFKNIISQYNINLFVIRGNHDANPANLNYMKEIEKYENIGYIEEEYPNIFYAKNGEVYNIENNTFLVLGGAYSVDKWYRLEKGYKWFADEQMTEEEKQNFWNKNITKVDTILSHTCPYANRPIHLFLTQIDQSTVDNSMENFLDEVKLKVEYKNWFFGHYHADEKVEEDMYMLYNGIIHYKPFKNLKIY